MSKNEDIEINLRMFDINTINKSSIVVIIGRRGSGKSVLLRDLMYNKRDIPIGLVMSHTDHLVHFYDQFIPSMLIHKHYDSSQVSKLFARQTKALKENWDDPSAFLLLDDVLSDKTWKKDQSIQEIFYNGRHYRLLFLLGIQAPMALGNELRGQIDYTFIFKTNIQADKERLYKHYAGALKSQEIFNIVLDATTEDHCCLVIDNKTMSNKIEDQVFYYKAKIHDKFKICSNDIWQINNKKMHQQQANEYANDYTKTEIPTKKGRVIINRKNK